MTDTVKTTFALEPETVHRIARLAGATHRSKSNVVNWLVAEAWEKQVIGARGGGEGGRGARGGAEGAEGDCAGIEARGGAEGGR